MGNILVVEDDPSIMALLDLSLRTAGFSVTGAGTAKAARAAVATAPPDLVILDLALPDADGISLLPSLKSKDVPVIILTARDALAEKVRGLQGGADDYVTKPFEELELIARVRAVLRRRGREGRMITVGALSIDREARTVSRDGSRIELTRREFDLLLCLAENRGMALSREQLLQRAWGYDTPGTTRTVDVHVQRLREKLATDAIATVTGTGYRLEA
jgi:two-component system, OmpR family, alkaline phosphatase synthesis response regulator PhoP